MAGRHTRGFTNRKKTATVLLLAAAETTTQKTYSGRSPEALVESQTNGTRHSALVRSNKIVLKKNAPGNYQQNTMSP